MAEGLPENGILTTIDTNVELEKMIDSFVCKAELKNKIVQLTGNALEIIPKLNQSFDLVFIDADKRNYKNYLDLVIDKVNSGGYILTDNVLWSGKVTLPEDKMDLDTKLIDEYNDYVQSHPKLKSILLPVRDGLYLSRKI
jgi:predicted O-methyltransferase YrrM